MAKHRGKLLVDFHQKLALGPKIMGGCESSESIHTTVSNGLNAWTKLGPDALTETVDMLKDLNILTPGCTTPFHVRDHKCMGGPLPDGMNVVNYMSHIDQSTNHFFYKQHANTSPEVMKPKKKKLYCQVFGVSEDSTFSFCSSCCEYFAAMPWVSHIDNSNKTLREKVANIC